MTYFIVLFCILIGLVSSLMEPSLRLLAWTPRSWMTIAISLSSPFPWAIISEVRYTPFISNKESHAFIAFNALSRLLGDHLPISRSPASLSTCRTLSMDDHGLISLVSP